jgi:hypothetical protein
MLVEKMVVQTVLY